MAKDELITITQAHYDDLVRDSNILAALEGAGVDNWDGYGYALEAIRTYDD